MKSLLFIVATVICFIACSKKSNINPAIADNVDSPKIDLPIIDSSKLGFYTVGNEDYKGLQSNNIKKYKTYLIKSGNKFCEDNDYPFGSYEFLHFSAILDSSCIYTNADPSNQADINKLFGFADCTSHHHANSARFGWNWHKGTLRIHAYCYSDSVRAYRELGTVKVNEEFDCKLTLLPNKYVFSLNGDTLMMDRHCSDTRAIGYLLYPYFGGNEPAPQDIRIKIKQY